jgi:hypothetical protein
MIVEIDRIFVMMLRIGEEACDCSELIYKIGSEVFHQSCHISHSKDERVKIARASRQLCSSELVLRQREL